MERSSVKTKWLGNMLVRKKLMHSLCRIDKTNIVKYNDVDHKITQI